jgi:hypothetical protein
VLAAQLLVLASALAFVGVGGLVGVRLLWLSRRTRGFPERVVGFSLFALAGVAWPLTLLANGPASLPDALLRAAVAGASLTMGLGWAGVFLFTWRVFQPGEGWARALAALGIAAEIGAGLHGAWRAWGVPEAAALRVPSPVALVLLLGAHTVYAWTALESFRYRALLRRRIPLGLADPLVADRFGLWGWTAVFGFGSIAPATWALATGGDPHTLLSRLGVGICGLVCSALLYFAFLPPAAYARFVRESAPPPLPGGGP